MSDYTNGWFPKQSLVINKWCHVAFSQVHDDEGLLACDLLPQAHIQTVGRRLGPHSHFGNQRGEAFTHMHKHSRNHSRLPYSSGIHQTCANTGSSSQHFTRSTRERKCFLRSAYRSLDFIQAWVFESGSCANVAQLSDGSLLDDSFHSLAVIRDIRVADWGMEICQNLSKGGDWAVEERWCQKPRSRSPFWTLEM